MAVDMAASRWYTIFKSCHDMLSLLTAQQDIWSFLTFGWSRWESSDPAEPPLLAANQSREHCPSNSCIFHADFPDSRQLHSCWRKCGLFPWSNTAVYIGIIFIAERARSWNEEIKWMRWKEKKSKVFWLRQFGPFRLCHGGKQFSTQNHFLNLNPVLMGT